MSRAKTVFTLSLYVLIAAILGGSLWIFFGDDIRSSGGGSGSGAGGAGAGSDTEAPAWPVDFEVDASFTPEYDRVVLVTIDTLRADHCSGYGYIRDTTPFLDSLTRKGVAFDRAVASVSHTAPSHATMLTGLAPVEHGVTVNGLSLPAEARDAATMFRAAGYETAAFLNVKFLQGVSNKFHVSASAVLQGEKVIRMADIWLKEKRRNDRFFMWVHLYDPHHWKHADRTPKKELRQIQAKDVMERPDLYKYYEDLHALKKQVPGQPYDLGWTVEIKDSHTIPTKDAEAYLDFVDAYDAHIRYADNQLERLYEMVESLDLPGKTLWIVTSDHGEGMGSHEVAGHGGRIYQEQLLVPLIFHVSDGSLQGRRVGSLVQHIDLFPTLAEIVGAELSGFDRLMSGASLWPLIRGETGWKERPAFSQRRPMQDIDPNAEAISSLQTPTHKYILHEPGVDEFFDLESDPLELNNLVETPSTTRDSLLRALQGRLEEARALGRGTPTEEIREDWAAELNALGYGGEEN